MALWRPYAQEVALDLSVPASKEEPVAPVPAPCVTGTMCLSVPYPFLPEPYPLYTESHCNNIRTYQPAVMYASTSTMSPDPTGSWTHSTRTAPSPSLHPEDSLSLSDDEEYQAFEREALQAMAARNGGSLLGNHPRMRRAVQTSQTADDAYRKQRERNNCAAKLSRERKKLREARLELRASFLSKKVAKLREQLATSMCERCRQTE